MRMYVGKNSHKSALPISRSPPKSYSISTIKHAPSSGVTCTVGTQCEFKNKQYHGQNQHHKPINAYNTKRENSKVTDKQIRICNSQHRKNQRFNISRTRPENAIMETSHSLRVTASKPKHYNHYPSLLKACSNPAKDVKERNKRNGNVCIYTHVYT